MNGTNVIGGGVVSSVPGTSWHAIGASDFNGDGFSDILWQNVSGQAAIWEMNGTSQIPGGSQLVKPIPDPAGRRSPETKRSPERQQHHAAQGSEDFSRTSGGLLHLAPVRYVAARPRAAGVVRITGISPGGCLPQHAALRGCWRADGLGPLLLRRLPQGLGVGLHSVHGLPGRGRAFHRRRPSRFRSKAANGGDAVRNRCAKCMSLVFGGEMGKTNSYTLYAGSLDDPSAFRPTIAIFTSHAGLGDHPRGFQGFRPHAGFRFSTRCPGSDPPQAP